jgi:hypothetical protein
LERDTQLAIAMDLNYLQPDRYKVLDQETYQVLGLLNCLIDSLRRKPAEP